MDERTKKIIWLVVGLITIFAYLDQSPGWLISDREEVMRYQWHIGIAAVALTYYIFKKDKSESLGIFAAGWIMLFSGLLDFLYFTIFHIQGKIVEYCVNADLNNWWSANLVDVYVLGRDCTTYLGLFLNSAIGIYFAIKAFEYLKRRH